MFESQIELVICSMITMEEGKEVISKLNEKLTGDYFVLTYPWFPQFVVDRKKSCWYTQYCPDKKIERDSVEWNFIMRDLATDFPSIEFRLNGEGVEREDWWVGLYKGERHQLTYCVPPDWHWL